MNNILLKWDKKRGYGYYPVDEFVYNEDYFDKYIRYEDTPIGFLINDFRIGLVDKFTRGKIIDIGIGCGSFIEKRGHSYGYDVNPKGIKWLQNKGLWLDFYNDNLNIVDGITFFDSLEHIPDLDTVFKRITRQWVFISIPIFRDLQHLLQSKHFRPDEHYHYFTLAGFLKFMAGKGFLLHEYATGEMEAGREDIHTFVYKRGDNVDTQSDYISRSQCANK